MKFRIEVAPTSEKYSATKNCFKEISKEHYEWEGYNLDIENTWAGVEITSSLKGFLESENNIVAIQNFYMDCLDKFNTVKPKLNDFI